MSFNPPQFFRKWLTWRGRSWFSILFQARKYPNFTKYLPEL